MQNRDWIFVVIILALIASPIVDKAIDKFSPIVGKFIDEGYIFGWTKDGPILWPRAQPESKVEPRSGQSARPRPVLASTTPQRNSANATETKPLPGIVNMPAPV